MHCISSSLAQDLTFIFNPTQHCAVHAANISEISSNITAGNIEVLPPRLVFFLLPEADDQSSSTLIDNR